MKCAEDIPWSAYNLNTDSQSDPHCWVQLKKRGYALCGTTLNGKWVEILLNEFHANNHDFMINMMRGEPFSEVYKKYLEAKGEVSQRIRELQRRLIIFKIMRIYKQKEGRISRKKLKKLLTQPKISTRYSKRY